MATANPTALFTTLPRTEFIQKNLGLVHSCAGRFTGRGIEYEELYSAGCLGLVKARAEIHCAELPAALNAGRSSRILQPEPHLFFP